jgi:hypothetical protein
MSASPTYLDLDAIETEVNLVVKLKGHEHRMVPITVQDFIQNMQIVQSMGTAGDITKEMELLITMLDKVFPTITRDELWKLTLPQLQAMFNMAQKLGGAEAVADEAKEKLAAEGNRNPRKPRS